MSEKVEYQKKPKIIQEREKMSKVQIFKKITNNKNDRFKCDNMNIYVKWKWSQHPYQKVITNSGLKCTTHIPVL